MAGTDIRDGMLWQVRLPARVSVETFESRLREAVPDVCGAVLTAAGDGWFALAEEASDALARDGKELAGQLRAFGADGVSQVTVRTMASLHRVRRAADPASVRPLRAGKSDPTAPGRYRERDVELDWFIDQCGLPEAWAMFAGPQDWAGVRVGHIDTGYTEHPALGFGATPWVHPDLGLNTFRRRQGPPEEGGMYFDDFVDEYAGPRDNLTGANAGHGTRTASLIAGLHVPPRADSDSRPFFGAAPGVFIVPYRVTDSVIVDHVKDDIAQAIRHAVDTRGCRVISISLGALFGAPKLARALDHAYERGVIVCAAAGNVVREVIYPGRYNRVVTVGGVTPLQQGGRLVMKPWSGSARGEYVDICGPADRIRRASTDRRGSREIMTIAGNGNGTSYATALCAGIAVLWLARHGAALDALYGGAPWARAAAFKALLTAPGICDTPQGWDTGRFGAGIYRADRLLAAPLPPLAGLKKEAPAAAPIG